MPVAKATAAATDRAAARLATSDAQSDIIVTAQRRDERLSRTPVSVAIISAATLAESNIVTEQDLRFAAPGLSVRSTAASNDQNFALRGQSQDAYSGTRPGVLPYINEVQISSAGSTAFYDLQSVQVLKGPQGTLFGRSATGGAVLFSTAKPTDTFGGYVSGLLGNYDARKIEGAINVPIATDRLMVRAAGFYEGRDGFQYNHFTDRRVGKIDRLGARLSVTADVGAVRNEFVFDYYRARSENTLPTVSGLLPFTGGVEPPFIPAASLYAGIATPAARSAGIATLQAFTGAPLAAVTSFYDGYFADPRRPATGLPGVLAAQAARDPYDVDSDARNAFSADNYVVTNVTTADLGTNTTLKNVFGYTHARSLIAPDTDGGPFGIAGAGLTGGGRSRSRQISDELQLLGSAFDDRLSYVTGLFYSDERNTNRVLTQFFDIVFGGLSQDNDATLTFKTYAAYGQGTLRLNDSGLSATIGLRYTSEKVRKIVLPTDTIRIALGDPAPAGFDYDQSRTFKRLSWQIGLQNQLSPDVLLYAVSRRAYKSGGFNKNVAPFVGSAALGGDAYEAERVTDAEVGAKFQGRLGDMPTRVSLAAFHNWVSNSQRTAYTQIGVNPATVTVNVPKARVYGVEIESQIKPLPWLTLGGSSNYTHSEYTDGSVFVVGQPQVFDRVPDTPKVSGTFYTSIDTPLTSDIDATLAGSLYYQSKFFTSPQSRNFAGTTLPSYTLVDIRLGIKDADRAWSLTANVKNIFDKVYYVGGLSAGEVYQANTRIIGQPRTFTVEARFNF